MGDFTNKEFRPYLLNQKSYEGNFNAVELHLYIDQIFFSPNIQTLGLLDILPIGQLVLTPPKTLKVALLSDKI